MPWYLFEPEKKPPYVAAEPEVKGEFRLSLSMLFGMLAFLSLIALIVAALAGAGAAVTWAVIGLIVSVGLAHLFLPRP